MGKGGQSSEIAVKPMIKEYTWAEVSRHAEYNDKWLVIDGQVYNISSWSKKHPGGSRLISHYAGQDATDAFRAFHTDLDLVKKYLKPLHLGAVQVSDHSDSKLDADFRVLRETAVKMGLFKSSYIFFFFNLAQLFVFEAAAYLVLSFFGIGWIPWTISIIMSATVQAQCGWLQHDFGHLSVFQNKHNLDHLAHYFTCGFIKINKDPDVRLEAMFVVGKQMPVMVAKAKKHSMPYNWQHHYWFAIGPPLLFPVYFQFMLFRHIFTRQLWLDLFVVLLFFTRLYILFAPFLGWGLIPYYFIYRCVESHWFTWVTQSNHIPMDIKQDEEEPWLKLQLHASCNVSKSVFNDWFTGHLNFQIEHHLFPTMPRHNLYKIAPLVKSLCEKHCIDYHVKGLLQAFVDIVRLVVVVVPSFSCLMLYI